MKMNKSQLAALSKLGAMIAVSDGNGDENEKLFLVKELVSFQLSSDEVLSVVEMGESMEASEALAIVGAMDNVQKMEACAFLGAMIAQDGKIDEKEVALWSLISQLCDLPTISIKEALDYMA